MWRKRKAESIVFPGVVLGRRPIFVSLRGVFLEEEDIAVLNFQDFSSSIQAEGEDPKSRHPNLSGFDNFRRLPTTFTYTFERVPFHHEGSGAHR